VTASGGEVVDLVVPPDLDGQRADRVVAALLGISRSHARQLVDEQRVQMSGDTVEPAERLSRGAVLAVVRPTPSAALTPWDRPLVVRYESPSMLVVDKPAGLVVHPGAGHRDDTLANILVNHYPELAALGEEYRWGLVHRLDRDTSGLLLVGRTGGAHTALQAQLKARTVRREYLALVTGAVEPATGTVEAPLGRDPEHPTRMALRQDGRFARTHYRRLARWSEVSLVAVTLDTGRTHQIRVHMSSIGLPVVGDRTYGRRRAASAGPKRLWLHARQLTFVDPEAIEGETTVVAPLPADLVAVLEELGAPSVGDLPPDIISGGSA